MPAAGPFRSSSEDGMRRAYSPQRGGKAPASIREIIPRSARHGHQARRAITHHISQGRSPSRPAGAGSFRARRPARLAYRVQVGRSSLYVLLQPESEVPPRPPAQTAPPMEGRPAPRRARSSGPPRPDASTSPNPPGTPSDQSRGTHTPSAPGGHWNSAPSANPAASAARAVTTTASRVLMSWPSGSWSGFTSVMTSPPNFSPRVNSFRQTRAASRVSPATPGSQYRRRE